MTPENAIKAMLLVHEEYRGKPYRCSSGKLTVGIGRNLDDTGITFQEALFLMRNDVAWCELDLKQNLKCYNSLNEPRKAALLDMCFNLGSNRLLTFKRMLAALEREDYEIAAREVLDSKYAGQVGQRAVTISNIIKTGNYPWVTGDDRFVSIEQD